MSTVRFTQIQERAIQASGFFCALFLFANYFSTASGVILSVILLLIWLGTAQFIDLLALLKKSPLALWAVILFAMFFVGLTYSQVANKDAWAVLVKYRELFFIPIFISLLSNTLHRDWVWIAFILASVITLVVSYLMYFGVLALNELGSACFKSRITHGIFIAYFNFYALHHAYAAKQYRMVYALLVVLSTYNLFFVVDSLTGQVLVITLVLLFAVQQLTLKKCMLAVALVLALMGSFLTFSNKADRITSGFAGFNSFSVSVSAQSDSLRLRYAFWENSLRLLAEKPFLGYGTGSYSKEYARISRSASIASNNPHNELLMIGVQFGAVGMFIYIGFISSLFYCAQKLTGTEKYMAQGITVCLVITSLFNSPLLDHTEGHWFAMMIALCFFSIEVKAVNNETLLIS